MYAWQIYDNYRSIGVVCHVERWGKPRGAAERREELRTGNLSGEEFWIRWKPSQVGGKTVRGEECCPFQRDLLYHVHGCGDPKNGRFIQASSCFKLGRWGLAHLPQSSSI